MNRKLAILTATLSIFAVVALTGCGAGGRKITKEEEAAWKTPPKEPPAGYEGNMLGTPGAPPPSATQGKK